MADKFKVKETSLKVSESFVDYYQREFEEPKRSTIALCNFVKKVLPSLTETFKAIEVGCGGGGTIFHLSKILPQTSWVGLDVATSLLKLARQYLQDNNKFQLKEGNFYELTNIFSKKSFDISFSIQTLTWLPTYDDVMKEIMAISKKWIFITSLFSDFDVDVFSDVVLYNDDWTIRSDSPYNYNVYSFKRFKSFCLKSGAKEVIDEDFVIDIDLSVPENKQMGTYTIKQFDSRRLQFSGPIFMPWKMIAIRME